MAYGGAGDRARFAKVMKGISDKKIRKLVTDVYDMGYEVGYRQALLEMR